MNKQHRKKLPIIDDEPPKYGLPGMGEYEEKRKQYEDEWKKECRKHFAEEAAKPRRGKTRPETPLDYDTILAQRREEEQRYRQENGDPYYGGDMKASTSDGYLNRDADSINDYQDYSNVEVRNVQREIDELGGTLDRIKYRGESRSTKNLDEYIDSNDVVDQYNRPHSYPQPYTTGAGYWQADKPESDPGFREQSNGVLDQQRKSYSLPRNGVKNRNGNPPRRTSQEEEPRRPPSPVFISLTGQHSEVSKAPIDKKQAYQADLAKQMEETRLRKQKEKEEQLRYERRIDEDNSNYNPWGRGGAGAPRTDPQGNLISNRNQAQQGHSLPRFEGNDPVGETRKIVRYQETEPDQQKFAKALGPEPLIGKRKESKGGPSNYQLDLQKQILDKKQREMEEKEKDLMEEVLWTRKIEEQQEKMKREYNDDQRKQQAREEQLRKRNDELRSIQEQQRHEAQRKMLDAHESARKEWWEAQQRGRNFQADPEDIVVANGNSPPIPAVRKPELPAIGKTTEANARMPTKMNQKPENSQLAGVYPAARTNILSQLSVMRQQLEQEQKALQEQLQKQKAIATYNVYDRKPPTMPIKNHDKPVMEKESTVKPDTFHRQNTRSIYRPGSPPRNGSNEAKTQVETKGNRSVYRPASPTTKKVPVTQRTPPQHAPKQRKQYETTGDLVRGSFLAGENVGEENAALSTLSRPEELRNSYASLRSLQGDSIFIGVDDEERIQMERNKPGTVRVGNDSRNYATNGNNRNNRRGYESQESIENEEGTYLERFMVKNLPR